MATTTGAMMAEASADRPLQLWLDVARPIQPRPLRERKPSAVRSHRPDVPAADPQMELRMVAVAPKPIEPEPIASPRSRREPPFALPPDATARDPRACFVAWLRDQANRQGPIGELAKAARIDPLFPRTGSAEDVRIRFDQAGADGDAHAALDDAERAYDRLA